MDERYVGEGSSVTSINDSGVNKFREMEKKFKFFAEGSGDKKKQRKERKERLEQEQKNLKDVIDFESFSSENNNNNELYKNVKRLNHLENQQHSLFTIKKVYTLTNIPGLIIAPGVFSPQQQTFWVKRCILDYTIGNPSNLSVLKNSTPWNSSPSSISQLSELKWVTCGYNFQWTERKYNHSISTQMPSDLSGLCCSLANAFGFQMKCETATINFYGNPKQQMTAHQDNSEEDLTHPIVSMSFGNDVVFLIGGLTKDIAPSAFFLRSGDVMLMSGPSRLFFHGVPRMFEHTSPQFLSLNKDQLEEDEKEEEEEVENGKLEKEGELFKQYMSNARININLRQVWNDPI